MPTQRQVADHGFTSVDHAFTPTDHGFTSVDHAFTPVDHAFTPADHGFTMVEMLVSMLLLTLVMAGTLAMQLTAMRSSNSSRMTSSAMTLGQSRLEEFRGANIANLIATPPAVDIDCFGAQIEPLTDCSTPVFTRTTQHVATALGLRADVTVQWMTRTGPQQLAVSMERSP